MATGEAKVFNERRILDLFFTGADVKLSCPGCGRLLG